MASKPSRLPSRLKPQVVVMDIGMRGIGGLSAARRIAKEAPASKVLMLSEYEEEEYVLEALGEARRRGLRGQDRRVG